MYFHSPLFIHAPSIDCLQAMAQVEPKVHAYMLLIGKLDKSLLINVSKSSMFAQSSPTFAYHRTSPDWKAACLFSITPKLSGEVAHDLDSDLPGMSKFTHGIKKGGKARGVRIYSAHRFHKPEKSTMIDLDALQNIQSNEHRRWVERPLVQGSKKVFKHRGRRTRRNFPERLLLFAIFGQIG